MLTVCSHKLQKTPILLMRKYFVVLGLMLSLVFPLKADAASVVEEGLVSYWTFDRDDIVDDIAKDVMRNNDATIIGNPTVVAGQVGNALKFDGIDDYVNLTTLGDFGSKIGDATFEAWVKTSVKDKWMVLLKQRIGLCNSCWGIELNGVEAGPEIEELPGSIVCYLCHNTGRSGCQSVHPSEKFPIFDGEWHHIAYVSKNYFEDGINPITGEPHKWWIQRQFIYVDGVQHGFLHDWKTAKGTYPVFTTPVLLGARDHPIRGMDGFFKGMIDEVRIYERSLTEDEVMQNFESRSGLKVESRNKLTTVWGALKR